MKHVALFSVIFLLFLAACTAQRPMACTADAKICPDGSAVGRIAPDCEFAPCPEPSDTGTGTAGCDYSKPEPKYVGKSADECSRIRFMCELNREYFEDECGCGCKLKGTAPAQNTTSNQDELKQNYCTPEQRNADACIQLYNPVCGWFDPKRVQCIKAPCADTYSNSCFACMDDKVLYWTEGECRE